MYVSEFANIAPPSDTVNRLAFDAVEFLRLAITHLETMQAAVEDGWSMTMTLPGISDVPDVWRDYCLTPPEIHDQKAMLRFPLAILQELVSGPPSLPARVFAVVRDHINEHDNAPGAEGAVLALAFAWRSLTDALNEGTEEMTDFDDVLAGARQIVGGNVQQSMVRGVFEEEAIKDILAGRPM